MKPFAFSKEIRFPGMVYGMGAHLFFWRRQGGAMDSGIPNVESIYRRHGNALVIEIMLHSASQLFNSMDPAPFKEKDLDRDAEEYIYNAVDEIPRDTPAELVIYLPGDDITPDIAASIPRGIQAHFEYQCAAAEREFARLMKQGRRALFIGSLILLGCLIGRQVLIPLGTVPTNVLAEALLIVAWVSMWEPLHIFLYGWYPIRQRQQVYVKIRDMSVQVKPAPGTPAVG
jgi:hypothetical protein